MVFLKGVYVVAIGVALSLLVVAGVEAFYPYPPYPHGVGPVLEPGSPEYEEERQRLMQALEEYQRKSAVYHRNVFFTVLPLGAVFAVVGTFVRRRLNVFGLGLILGGFGTMIFATVPWHLSNILRFAGIAATLAVLVLVGYKVFLSPRRS